MSKQDTGRTSITHGGEQVGRVGHASTHGGEQAGTPSRSWRAGRHAEPLGGEQAGTPSPLSCVDDTRGTGGRRRNEGTGSG